MDSVVVDSSVVIKWLVVEAYSTEARWLLDDYQRGLLDLLVPDFLFAEVGNIVWKKHRFQGLAAADAQLVMDAFRALTFNVTPTADLVEDAFRVAVAHQRTVYDMLYVALSVRHSCRLVTADERLVNSLGGSFPNLLSVAQWPSKSP